jgi:hypothetical protein
LLDQDHDEGLWVAVQDLADTFAMWTEHSSPVTAKKKVGKQKEARGEIRETMTITEWPAGAISVANCVVQRMGVVFTTGRIPYESQVSRRRYKTHSDVVILCQLQVGAIRHWAL